jgi:hypothetical protein
MLEQGEVDFICWLGREAGIARWGRLKGRKGVHVPFVQRTLIRNW